MAATFTDLLLSRKMGEQLKFWQPLPLDKEPFTLFGMNSQPVRPRVWGVEKTVERIIALGLVLELPVGQWVMTARTAEKKNEESKFNSDILELLASNIKDEHGHAKGFTYAEEAYPVSAEIKKEADTLAQKWLDLDVDTLWKAAVGEAGIFLGTLGCLRLFGGKSLFKMADAIAQDEARHVKTNMSLLNLLGFDTSEAGTPQSLKDLWEETVRWVYQDLKIPGSEVYQLEDVDLNYMLRVSKEMLFNFGSKDFEKLVTIYQHNLPFEIGNEVLYTHVTGTADEESLLQFA